MPDRFFRRRWLGRAVLGVGCGFIPTTRNNTIGKVEIIRRREPRRRCSLEEKLSIVAEADLPDAAVSRPAIFFERVLQRLPT